jgi:hypothetical protein
MTLKGQAMKVKLLRKVNASLVVGQGAGAGMDFCLAALIPYTADFLWKTAFLYY